MTRETKLDLDSVISFEGPLTSGPGLFGRDAPSINSTVKDELVIRPLGDSFVVTAANVRQLAYGDDELEIKFGELWSNPKCKNDVERAIHLLQDYSESRLGWFRNNCSAIRGLVNLIKERKTLDEVVTTNANLLYLSVSNKKGGAALCLKYLLLHCSGHYTHAVQLEVIQAIQQDIIRGLEALGSCH